MQTDLKTARERRGWDQKTLSQRSGVDQSIISRIESGQIKNPSNATVTKLEVALRLRRGTLVFGAGEVQSSTSEEPPIVAADRRGTMPDRRESVGRREMNGHGGPDRRGSQPDRRQLPGRRVTNGVGQ